MLNKVMLIGNLGADPDVRYLPNGGAVANLSLATSERWKDKQSGEMKEATQWHRVSCFGRLAEIASEYLHKGSKVFVEGSIQYRDYEKDGVKKYATDIKAFSLKMLDPKGSGAPKPKPEPSAESSSQDDDFSDPIPF